MSITETPLIHPNQFNAPDYWYEKVFNAQIHPLIQFFMTLSPDRLIDRYCHLHPTVDREKLAELLAYKPKHFAWSGADLFHVTSAGGKRQMVLVETNSCPSGQKSMPLLDEVQEAGGYRQLMEKTFYPRVQGRRKSVAGKLAVLYDKNIMEAQGYAATMADVFNEPVYLVPCHDTSAIEFRDRVLYVRVRENEWEPIRAAFRYVTQRPWAKIPVNTRTHILNPVIACLSGGRNKMIAAKAYDFLNADLREYGLELLTPETLWDVSKAEIPLWVQKLGGQAVIKNPYSNAGQGVYTIVNQEELDAFMALDHHYDRFIVQSLIGNYKWSSEGSKGRLYHIGTVPNKQGNSYVADLRVMIHSTADGFRPLAMYARRAAKPLTEDIDAGNDSWSILGTNLSKKHQDGSWGSDTSRLMLMDRRDFNKLGIGLDDLIDGYIQTVLATVAIDQMAQRLVNNRGELRNRLFRSLNNDDKLVAEIISSAQEK